MNGVDPRLPPGVVATDQTLEVKQQSSQQIDPEQSHQQIEMQRAIIADQIQKVE